jgi:hypothetical protein
MKNTNKWRIIILIALIMFSMAACDAINSIDDGSDIGGGGNNIDGDDRKGDDDREKEDDPTEDFDTISITITNLGVSTGFVGITVMENDWNRGVEEYRLIQDEQITVNIRKAENPGEHGVQNADHYIVLWFEDENEHYVYTAGTNIDDISGAQLFNIADINNINFDQFRAFILPEDVLTITGYEWLNNMPVWVNVFDGDNHVAWAYKQIADNTLSVTLRSLYKAWTEGSPHRLELNVWPNRKYELSGFIPSGGSKSVHISQFTSNYHELTITGFNNLAGRSVWIDVYDTDGLIINSHGGFGISGGTSINNTLMGDLGWTQDGPFRLRLSLGDGREYELQNFTPVGSSTSLDISQFKNNYHWLTITGFNWLVGRIVRADVYNDDYKIATMSHSFGEGNENSFSFLLIGDLNWTEKKPFRLRLRIYTDCVYELLDFTPKGNNTKLNLNQFTKMQ